jgi:hypothetical protein
MTKYKYDDTKESFTIKAKWPILLGLTTVWLICTALYPIIIKIPENVSYIRVILKSLITTVPLCGVFFTALLMSFNSLEASSNIRESNIFNRDVNSFKLLDRWDGESLKKVRKITRKLKKERDKISNDELTKMIEAEDGELEDSLIEMTNFFETVYLQILHKTVNETQLKIAFRECYLDIFKRFEKVWFEKKKDDETMKNLIELKKRWENNA